MTQERALEKLKEHRIFRNECIFFTILGLVIGLFVDSKLGWDSSSVVFMTIGIMGLMAIFNIVTYRENKKDYDKLAKLNEWNKTQNDDRY